MKGRPRIDHSPDVLKKIAVEYFNSENQKEYLKHVGMSRTTLWRRLKEAGIQIKSQCYVG